MLRNLDEVKEWIKETNIDSENVGFYEDPCYAEAIIGTDYYTGAIVYDEERMARCLLIHYPEDFDDLVDAFDYIEHNLKYGWQDRSTIPPIILARSPEVYEEDMEPLECEAVYISKNDDNLE